MKKIMLVCSSGSSTSLLVKKMQEAAQKKGLKDVEIVATSQAEAKNHYDDTDVLLLGPQVRYLYNELKKTLAGKKIVLDVINSRDYGMMNGKAVLEQALKLANRESVQEKRKN
ncbi:MAG: PTS sugar transporter subunit IIB [Tepidanaerobacter acetatoxydans]|uniref:PTS sugar transporter subunit IIB n=1 Tax=Tepidanaerobacter acetatoxydans TaxID=499229 RepID=UPI0026F12E57|nr:PTS sugar transporter subunit IIB [Tepidanaerobacter acetatoxydans]NLU11209.1 PTS sugar transporter subunit IIB [Tepidanaerobacter acetatoxydans]